MHHTNQQYDISKEGGRKHTLTPYVTGASVLGIRFKDGIMLAADTLASYGSLARYTDIKRIQQIGQYALIAGTGELSDFQYIIKTMQELINEDFCLQDGYTLHPKEIYSYLARVLYSRRSQMDPLWNQLIVAGHRNGEPFLGFVDLYGSSFLDNTIATGYGAYIAQPLLRKGWKADLDARQAKQLLEDCLRVLFYRDGRAFNKIQVATITSEGCNISEPSTLETNWNLDVGNTE